MRNDFDALGLKSWQQLVVVDGVLSRHQGLQRRSQAVERLDRIGPLAIVPHMRHQMGFSAHLKELIKVGGHDTEIAQALQQRHVVAHSPTEHPFIECQDAVVPVQKVRHPLLGLLFAFTEK